MREEMLDEVVSTVRIGSIKQALKAKVKKPSVSNEEVEEVPTEKELQTPSKDDFVKSCKAYAAKLNTAQKRSLSSYFNDPLFELEGSSITFIVGSKTLKNELESSLTEFKIYLAEYGFALDFDFQINSEKVAEYKLFTPKQQFNALSKDYPELKEFAQRFGLDFDV